MYRLKYESYSPEWVKVEDLLVPTKTASTLEEVDKLLLQEAGAWMTNEKAFTVQYNSVRGYGEHAGVRISFFERRDDGAFYITSHTTVVPERCDA